MSFSKTFQQVINHCNAPSSLTEYDPELVENLGVQLSIINVQSIPWEKLSALRSEPSMTLKACDDLSGSKYT